MANSEARSEVSVQREAMYGPSFAAESLAQRADDLRRNLILKYGVSPELRAKGEQPRDMWLEIAKDIIDLTGGREDVVGLDAGTSSGYFIKKMLESGFKGSLIGADVIANHLPSLREELSRDYPWAKIDLGEADAEKLDSINLLREPGLVDYRQIPDNFFDFSVSLNTYHHTDQPEEILKSLWRVTRPGGYVATMARAVGHFHNIYDEIAPAVAKEFNTAIPKPFYKRYQFMDLDNFVTNFAGYEEVSQGLQADWLYIDGSEEGWDDLTRVVYSLLPDFSKLDGSKSITAEELKSFLERKVKTKYFKKNKILYRGLDNQYPEGFVTDFVFQKYKICKVIK